MIKQLRNIVSHPFFRGSFVFTTLSFFSSFLSYVFNFMLAHLVSVSQYGEYSSALSYLLLLSVPFGAMSLILMRKIGAISQKERNEYVVALERLLSDIIKQNGLKIVLGGGLVGVGLFFFANLKIESIFFILALVAVTFSITLYTSIFQAEKEFMFAGAYLCVLAVFKVLGGGLAILIHSELWFLYCVIIAAHFLTIMIGKWHLDRRVVGKLPKIHLPNIMSIVQKRNFYLPVITFLGLTALISLDIMMVKRFFEPDQVGFYAALSLLGKIILYVSLPLTAVAFSYFTGSESKGNSLHVLFMSMGLLGICAIVSIAGYTLLPSLVVRVLFGQQYLSIVPLVWLTALFGSSYSFATLLGQYWISQHHQISMAALGCAFLQALLLFLYHDSFMTILIVSIACSTILSLIYLVPFIYQQRQPYAASP